jgi:hypothetical protein
MTDLSSTYPDWRIVLCECCGSEGRIYHGEYDDGWSKPCDVCEGTGGEIIETQPITMEDLDDRCDSD